MKFSRAIGAAMLFATIFATAPPAVAQETPETVVVTATQTPTDLSKIGSSISVIADTDMQRQQTVFATDILQTIPGVAVTQSGPPGTSSSVQLRGAPSYDTFVLIDGVEVSDPTQTQAAFAFSQLTASGIDRIEVLRGSQSVLYGGDAVGGVINIITQKGQGDLDGLAFAEGGSYGTYLVGTRIRGGLDDDRFGYNATVQYLSDSGFSAADSNLPGNSEADAYRNLSSNGRFDYAVSGNVDVKLVYRYAGGTDNYDACGGPFCDEGDLGDHFNQYSGRLSSDFRLFGDFFTGDVGASWSHDARTNFDHGASDYFYNGDREKFDFKGVLNFDPNNIVVFGAETKRDFADESSDPRVESIRTNGFYAEYQATPLEPLTLTLGARLDDNQRFGDYATWRATGAYNIESTGTKLKASYATGFRAPSLFELFGICCGDPDLGNPNLSPEKSRSWDIGIEQRLLSDSLQLGVTYFRLDTFNMIQFGGAFGTSAPNYFNVPGTTTSQGVENSITWTPLEHLSLNLAYTYDDVKDDTGARVLERPRNVLDLDANCDFLDGRANANLNIRYTSDTVDDDFSTFPATIVNLGSYAVVTLGGSYKVFDKTELYGRVENLFDRKYETDFGYGTQGRSVFVGVRQGF